MIFSHFGVSLPPHVLKSLTLSPNPFNLSAHFDICSVLHFLSAPLFLTSPPLFPPLLQSLLAQVSSREYIQHGAERFGAGGGQSRRLFPLHFTQGLEMRQTQLQTDEALLRVPRGACGSGTDHFGRMGNLLKALLSKLYFVPTRMGFSASPDF